MRLHPAPTGLIAILVLSSGLRCSVPLIARAQGAPIRISVVADLSGPGSVYGLSVRNGLLLALAGINGAGGIAGSPLTLAIGDGRSSVARVRSLFAASVAAPRVVALIGPTLSSEALAVDPVAQRGGLPVLATSNTAQGITRIGDHIFRVSLGDAEIIPRVLAQVGLPLHLARVAIIYDRQNAATRDEAHIFRQAATRLGMRVVDTETFPTGARQFGSQFARIRAAKPDAVLVGALAQEGGTLLAQGRHSGLPATVRFIGANGMNAPTTLTRAGVAAEGLIVGTTWYASNPSPYNRDFIAAYTARYHRAPDQYAAQAYDGLHVLAAALRDAGASTGRDAVRAALATVRDVPVVLGSTGVFSFTAARDANLIPTVQVVRGGHFTAFG